MIVIFEAGILSRVFVSCSSFDADNSCNPLDLGRSPRKITMNCDVIPGASGDFVVVFVIYVDFGALALLYF